jgi:hypothetical protein
MKLGRQGKGNCWKLNLKFFHLNIWMPTSLIGRIPLKKQKGKPKHWKAASVAKS